MIAYPDNEAGVGRPLRAVREGGTFLVPAGSQPVMGVPSWFWAPSVIKLCSSPLVIVGRFPGFAGGLGLIMFPQQREVLLTTASRYVDPPMS